MPTCPICNTPALTSRTMTIDMIAAALAPPLRDADRHRRMRGQVERLWPAGEVSICVCDACQFGFAWPLVAGDAAFYAVLHERTGYPRDRWEFREALELIGPQTRRVLDIGAGKGDFLATLPMNLERHGVEASDAMCSTLRERALAAHQSIADAAGAFDLVTMFHVLQYFADPVATLREAASKLSPSGRIALSLPNALAGFRLDDLRSPPHPLTRWSESAVAAAAREAGLTIERRAFIPQPWSILLWIAHAHVRERGGFLFARVDATSPSRLRTILLTSLSSFALPRVLPKARGIVRRSQVHFVLRRALEGVTP